MNIANNKHDIIAIQVYDKRDAEMPNAGLVRIKDLETEESRWIDLSSKSARKVYSKWWYDNQQKLINTLNMSKVDFSSIATDDDYVKSLITLFKNRSF